jgi:hypothetical protein
MYKVKLSLYGRMGHGFESNVANELEELAYCFIQLDCNSIGNHREKTKFSRELQTRYSIGVSQHWRSLALDM